MKLINTYELEIKKSKFIAYYYDINNVEDTLNILNNTGEKVVFKKV